MDIANYAPKLFFKVITHKVPYALNNTLISTVYTYLVVIKNLALYECMCTVFLKMTTPTQHNIALCWE